MTRSVLISSQVLLKYESAMTTSVYSSMTALARDINARWSPNPSVFIVESLSFWRDRLSAMIFRYNEEIVRSSAGYLIEGIGVKNDQVDFILNFIRPELRTYSRRQASLIEAYLKNRISLELASGDNAKARKRISEILSNRAYASRIARTEVHNALERGSFEAAKSLSARMTKEWISREDAVVRPHHAAAHGQIRELESSFDVGGEAMMFPGDPSASAKNLVNCRCSVRYRMV